MLVAQGGTKVVVGGVIWAMSWLDYKVCPMRHPVAVCALIRHSNLIRDEAFSLAGGLFWLQWRRRVGEEDAVGSSRRAVGKGDSNGGKMGAFDAAAASGGA